MSRRPSGIIFDGDGVLFDSELVTNQAFRTVMERHGIVFTRPMFEPYIGIDTKTMLADINERYGLSLTVEGYEEERDAEYHRLCAETNGPPPIDGVFELLDWLDEQEIPYGLATGASTSKMIFNLENTGLAARFSVRVCRDDIVNGKPAPDIYLETARRMGIDVGQSIVVEDTIAGLKGGIAAGAEVLAITGTFTPDELRPYSSAIFNNHHQALEYLRSIVPAARFP